MASASGTAGAYPGWLPARGAWRARPTRPTGSCPAPAAGLGWQVAVLAAPQLKDGVLSQRLRHLVLSHGGSLIVRPRRPCARAHAHP